MRLYTTKEAMKVLKISRDSIYTLIQAGILKPRKRRNRERGGRGWNFFTEEDIKAAIDYMYPPVDEVLNNLNKGHWKYLRRRGES